jgi:hypothetical protein
MRPSRARVKYPAAISGDVPLGTGATNDAMPGGELRRRTLMLDATTDAGDARRQRRDVRADNGSMILSARMRRLTATRLQLFCNTAPQFTHA